MVKVWAIDAPQTLCGKALKVISNSSCMQVGVYAQVVKQCIAAQHGMGPEDSF